MNKNLAPNSVVEDTYLTIVELTQATQIEVTHIVTWVREGILEPAGENPEQWVFSGESLRRAKLACKLFRDFEINPSGIALAIDLLNEITSLRKQLSLHQENLKHR